MPAMKIATPQINYEIGETYENRDRIITAIQEAASREADLVVFPELALCGAWPGDMLEREYYLNECLSALETIADTCRGVAALVGCPNWDPEDGILFNTLFLLQEGEITGEVSKAILSDYDVFDESRYFVGGDENTPLLFQDKQIRILFDEYEADAISPDDFLVIHVGATPFSAGSLSYRKETFGSMARTTRKPILSLNHTGANTSLIFDGNTLLFNTRGEIVGQGKSFEEELFIFDTREISSLPAIRTKPEKMEMIHAALLCGIRDYFRKNRLTRAVVGLSGGLDSAVVAALAVEALGSEAVQGILMPSPFSSGHSVSDAVQLADNLGISHYTLPIETAYNTLLDTLRPVFGERPFNVAEENLQARIRGMLLMAISNKFGSILLNTSNKSESAVGYGTLYGDMCGALSPLGDLYKTEVYELARYINRHREIIPVNTIQKAPSAELRPNQTDQDSLPDYPTLDIILKGFLEEDRPARDLIAAGYEAETVKKVIRLVQFNEYKRAQSPPVLKLSGKAFGSGRRMPLTARWNL